MKKPVRVEKTTNHFDIQYSVWFNNTVVAYCDTKTRADFIARSLWGWMLTEDYIEWMDSTPYKRKKNGRL